MPRLLVVHHTPSPTLQAMLEAVVAGAHDPELEKVDVTITPALAATVPDVLAADGFMLGTPTALPLGTPVRIPVCSSRLAEHLGLGEFQIPQDWNELIRHLAHPGVAIFDFHAYQVSHMVYIHDLRWLLHHWPAVDGLPASPADRPLWAYGWPLGPEHMARGPVLGALLIDEREPPRASAFAVAQRDDSWRVGA